MLSKADVIKVHGVDAASHGDAPDELVVYVVESVDKEGTTHALLPDDHEATRG